MGSQGEVEHVEVGALLGEGDVAVGIGIRPAQESDVDGERAVAHDLAAVDLQDVGERARSRGVHPATAMPGVDEGAQPDVGEQAWPPGADLAIELADDTTGQDVGLDLVVGGQGLHPRRPHPVAPDNR